MFNYMTYNIQYYIKVYLRLPNAVFFKDNISNIELHIKDIILTVRPA